MLATFRRDHFVCRYQHCGRRTIYVPVLRALSALFPDLIPYQKNWRPIQDHILYWTYGTSIDHRISFPHGGTSSPDNLITACFMGNDIKNMMDAAVLGWRVGAIRSEEWDGLRSYARDLEDAARRAASVSNRPPSSGAKMLSLSHRK
jgi:hypothetical protein